jgi:serine/threonine protein kinase
MTLEAQSKKTPDLLSCRPRSKSPVSTSRERWETIRDQAIANAREISTPSIEFYPYTQIYPSVSRRPPVQIPKKEALVPESAISERNVSRPFTQPVTSANSPKLLSAVEDAIKRLILPELNAVKKEQRLKKERRLKEQQRLKEQGLKEERRLKEEQRHRDRLRWDEIARDSKVPLWKGETSARRRRTSLTNSESVERAKPRRQSSTTLAVVGEHVNPGEDHKTLIAQKYGWQPGHQTYDGHQAGLLIIVEPLGAGTYGSVEHVKTSSQGLGFVRKRVQLPPHLREQRLEILKGEVEALRSLKHKHIVEIIGSYEEKLSTSSQFYYLLMAPVGEQDLQVYLQMHAETTTSDDLGARELLKKWFKCLASALTYMHKRGLRHQDIKPSNLICRQKDIYFTDFGSSGRCKIGDTTSTDTPARTSAMYAAPEVVDGELYLSRHGRGTDVFALGVVFCEMLAVIRGLGVQALRDFVAERSRSTFQGDSQLLYGRKVERLHRYFAEDEFYGRIIRDMLANERRDRPTARTVAQRLTSSEFWVTDPCDCGIYSTQKKSKRSRSSLMERNVSGHDSHIQSARVDTRQGALDHTSLLIEYFEGAKSTTNGTKPSVRVRVTPSASKKSTPKSDHIQITETGKHHKPSYTRRVLLPSDSDKSPTGVNDAEDFNHAPVEVEQLSEYSNISEYEREAEQRTDFSPMAANSHLDGHRNTTSWF